MARYIRVLPAIFQDEFGNIKIKSNPKSHTSKYNITRLVYYEQYENAEAAIDREKLIKSKSRAYRIKLIETNNPDWSELYHRLD